jgi:hypothetical protein
MSTINNFSNIPQYRLEKSSKKYECPNCNKKTFVYYINTETDDYLPQQYGRCDRESKCSYHLSPYSDGYAKTSLQQQTVTKVTNGTAVKQKYFCSHPKPQTIPQSKSQRQSKIVYFDFDTFRETLEPQRYEKNMFIQNLFYRVQFPFDIDEVTKVIQLYRLGTVAHGYRAGATTFPFIDINGNIRAVQVKQFDKTNHTTGTDFLHSIIEKYCTKNNKPLPEWLTAYNQNEKKVSCLFGEHLLKKYPLNPVALVEAPKTAVYGSLYFGLPDKSPENLIWLAVYNKSSFSLDKLKALQGRDIFTFPDLSKDGNTFKEWETKAKEIEKRLSGTRFVFSDLLEQLAPDRDKNEGYDLADYLITKDWRLFRKQNIPEKAKSEAQPEAQHQFEIKPAKTVIDTALKTEVISPTQSTPTVEIKRIEKREKKQSEIWSKEISELETFFSTIKIPDTLIQLNSCSTIVDVPEFIKSHLSTVKANEGKRVFSPYLNRLQELKQILTFK